MYTGCRGEHSDDLSRLENRVKELEREVSELNAGQNVTFRLENIKSDGSKVAFYTGFPSYAHLKACFDFFGYESAVQGDIHSG